MITLTTLKQRHADSVRVRYLDKYSAAVNFFRTLSEGNLQVAIADLHMAIYQHESIARIAKEYHFIGHEPWSEEYYDLMRGMSHFIAASGCEMREHRLQVQASEVQSAICGLVTTFHLESEEPWRLGARFDDHAAALHVHLEHGEPYTAALKRIARPVM